MSNTTTLIHEASQEQLSALRHGIGQDVAVFGSSDLALTLIRLGCIDEYRILINPLVVGKGRSVFDGLGRKLDLELLRTRTFSSGSVLLSYIPKQLQTGTQREKNLRA